MLIYNKEQYMKILGTNQKEQNSLIPITFNIFIHLEKGDTIYKTYDWEYFIKVPYIINYCKWLFSNDILNHYGKQFYYKQISFTNKLDIFEYYADSAGHNYKDLYIHKDLLSIINNRIKQKKK